MRSAGFCRFPECAPVGHPARSSGSDSLRETAVARTLTDITKTFSTSFVPDVFTGMSGRPAYLEAAWELFQDDVGLCKMDGETRRIIVLKEGCIDAETLKECFAREMNVDFEQSESGYETRRESASGFTIVMVLPSSRMSPWSRNWPRVLLTVSRLQPMRFAIS